MHKSGAWAWAAIGCMLVACGGDREGPPQPEPRPLVVDAPEYDGEIWCVVLNVDPNRVLHCTQTEAECNESRGGEGVSCHRRVEGAARNVRYRLGMVWSLPRVSIHPSLQECVLSRARDDEDRVSSVCVPLRDEGYAAVQRSILDAEMRARAEETRHELWCHGRAGRGATAAFCYEGQRECERAWRRLGSDRGLELSPCERRPEAFAYSYTDRIYRYRSRMIFGTPEECAESLADARAENRRGIGGMRDLTECYVLASRAR